MCRWEGMEAFMVSPYCNLGETKSKKIPFQFFRANVSASVLAGDD